MKLTNGLKLGLIALALAWTGMVATAFAEVTEPGDALKPDSLFMKYMGSQPFAKALGATAKDWDTRAGFSCTDNYSVKPLNVSVYKKVVIGQGDLHPTAGEWLVKYTAVRCGKSDTINALVTADSGQDVNVEFLVPGHTELFPELINNLKGVLPQAIGDANCKQVVVLNAKPGVPEGVTPEKKEMKYETWSVRGCDKAVDLVWRIEEGKDGNVQAALENRVPTKQ